MSLWFSLFFFSQHAAAQGAVTLRHSVGRTHTGGGWGAPNDNEEWCWFVEKEDTAVAYSIHHMS